MSIPSLIGSSVLLLIGAALGFLPAFFLERSKQRHALKTRWDTPLFELCKQFAGTTRQMAHIAGEMEQAVDRTEQARQLDLKHAELRGLFEQVRLLGSARLQLSARLVVHHLYAVRAVAEGKGDVRAEKYPGTIPYGRVKAALKQFLIAAREQLGVADPGDVTGEEVNPNDSQQSELIAESDTALQDPNP